MSCRSTCVAVAALLCISSLSAQAKYVWSPKNTDSRGGARILDLTGAAANANALIAIGLKQQSVDLGWCGNVLLVPTILLPTKTASNGSITLSVPHTAMQGLPQTDLLFQFAWDDKAVKGGVGLSNLRPYKSPAMPGAHTVARIYKASFGSTTNGDELATTGSVGNRYGLIVGWLQ